MHGSGLMEGLSHDWTLFARSELDVLLGSVLVVAGKQYLLYADSVYSERIGLQLPSRGIICLMRGALKTLQCHPAALHWNLFSRKSSSTGPLLTLSEICASTSPL